jgi:RNA recognition motif-containing protein
MAARTNKLFMGSLSNAEVTRGEIERLFSKYGAVVDVNVQHPPGSTGYAFIEFADDASGLEAVRELRGRELFGSDVDLQVAKPRRERGSGDSGAGVPGYGGPLQSRVGEGRQATNDCEMVVTS